MLQHPVQPLRASVQPLVENAQHDAFVQRIAFGFFLAGGCEMLWALGKESGASGTKLEQPETTSGQEPGRTQTESRKKPKAIL